MSEYLFDLTNHLASLAQHSENAAFNQLAATLSGLPQNRPTPGSSSCPTSEKSLDEAIQSLPDRLSIRDVAEKAARLSPWAEASRGIPEFFAGGYAYSILVDEHGPAGPEPIRLGLLLQQSDVAYPGHAHDAEEFYFILSGEADWRIDDREFRAAPGDLIHHPPAAIHAMETLERPLLAAWVWRGNLTGRFWYESAPDVDCPRS